jgi:succinate dehydrogenase iron-sulfur subunit
VTAGALDTVDPSAPAGAPGRTITVRVRRTPPAEGGKARDEEFRVPAFPRMSVLDALFAIQREQDRSLSFRCSCRLGMCGTCAMIVNGREGLACQTLVESLPGDTIALRPLAHLPVIKDLVVDLEPFFDRYRQVKPYFVPRAAPAAPAAGPGPSGSTEVPKQAPEQTAVIRQAEGPRRWVDPALGCITCGICHSACTVVGLNDRFPGPAALNRTFTLTNDVRDGAREERLAAVGGPDGVWRCHQLFNCASACPRHIVPTQAIRQLRLDAAGRAGGPLAAPLRWLRGRLLPLAETPDAQESQEVRDGAAGD